MSTACSAPLGYRTCSRIHSRIIFPPPSAKLLCLSGKKRRPALRAPGFSRPTGPWPDDELAVWGSFEARVNKRGPPLSSGPAGQCAATSPGTRGRLMPSETALGVSALRIALAGPTKLPVAPVPLDHHPPIGFLPHCSRPRRSGLVPRALPPSPFPTPPRFLG